MTQLILFVDNEAITLALVGIASVFVSLLLIFFTFSIINKILQNKLKAKLRKQGMEEANLKNLEMPADVAAAIGLALHLYFEEIHDTENMKLTITKVSRTYSPWSSKLYGLRNLNLR